METEIGFIDRSELSPESKDTELCIECRAKGLNLCDIDEICQLRLATALGDKNISIIAKSIDFASEKGLVEVRTVRVKGKNRPSRFIKITEQGKMFFGTMK
jgi:hypothetical protein